MSWNDVIGAVRTQLPQFNDDLLLRYRKEQIDSSPAFFEKVFRASVRTLALRTPIEYVSYRILPPEAQVDHMINGGSRKDRMSVQHSELQLVEYTFLYEGERIPVYLFLPYLFRNAIRINDTQYEVLNNIVDNFIIRNENSVLIKVLKQTLTFTRNPKSFDFKSIDGTFYSDMLIGVKAFSGKAKTKIQTTIVLYILAQYGFVEGLKRLLITDLSFVEYPDTDDGTYKYFQINENVYLKANTENMDSTPYRRVVASILYTLSKLPNCLQTVSDAYDVYVYRQLLGGCINGRNYPSTLAASNCEDHLESLSIYLDEIARQRLIDSVHIKCEDIFQLFIVVFHSIDDWLIDYSPNNLFDKRLSGIDTIMKFMVKNINTRFYGAIKNNKKMDIKGIRQALKMPSMMIGRIYEADGVNCKFTQYNDNELFSTIIKKQRPISGKDGKKSGKNDSIATRPEFRLSPTFLAIESIWSIPSSNPLVGGDINPFAVIDKDGRFLKEKMPWYSEIEGLGRYLK